MIVRARIAIRLAGRRREPIPTTLWEGLAYLVVTGSFQRYLEVEPLSEPALAAKLAEVAQRAGWTAAECGATSAERAFSRAEGAGSGVALAMQVGAAARHARGKPCATLEVTAVLLPGRGEDPARQARHMLADRHRCEERLAAAQEAVERLTTELSARARELLPVETLDVEVERGFPRGWTDEALAGLPDVAASWITALQAPGIGAAWLDALPPAADGGGVFDVHGADGGGALDAVAGHHDAGGGNL